MYQNVLICQQENDYPVASVINYVVSAMLQYFMLAFGPWCNGSTADFGSVDPGSSPGGPA